MNGVVSGQVTTARIRFLDEARAARESRTFADVSAESGGSIPAGRYGTPEEYADVITFLASARASYVTRSVNRVDDGYVPSI